MSDGLIKQNRSRKPLFATGLILLAVAGAAFYAFQFAHDIPFWWEPDAVEPAAASDEAADLVTTDRNIDFETQGDAKAADSPLVPDQPDGSEPVAEADRNEDDEPSAAAALARAVGEDPAAIRTADKAPSPPDMPEPPSDVNDDAPGQVAQEDARDPEPWEQDLHPNRPMLAVQADGFEGGDDIIIIQHGDFPAELLRRWIEPVAGHDMQIGERRWHNRFHSSEFRGLGRLRAPWPDRAVLRLALFDAQDFRIHCWNGTEGVSLRLFPHHRSCWAAFHATREGQAPVPSELALVTTDNGRFRRTYEGTIDLRYQDGALVLTRGELRLLTAPLSAPPEEIYFEGHANIRRLSMRRSAPIPPAPPNPRPLVVDGSKPEELDWSGPALDDDVFHPSNEGAVELVLPPGTEQQARETDELWAATSLGRSGLYEIIVHVEDAQPGTGVFLGAADGRPLHRFGFSRDRRTGWTAFGFTGTTTGQQKPNRAAWQSDIDPRRAPPPYAHRRQWLRIVAGLGTLKLWTSGDGRNWGRGLHQPVRSVPAESIRTVGLYGWAGEEPRSIKLRHLEVREFTGILSSADAEIRRRVPEFEHRDQATFADWLGTVMYSRPAEIDEAHWRRASAVETLRTGVSASLGRQLLDSLIADGLAQPQPVAERVRLLEEAALLSDLWDHSTARDFANWYAELGRRLIDEGDPRPWSSLGPALMAAPIWSDADFSIAPDRLVRHELLHMVLEDRWDEALAFCQQLRFWHEPAHPHRYWYQGLNETRRLIEWAGVSAGNRLQQPTAFPIENHRRTGTAAIGHPLIWQVGKEGYNIMAEFESAVGERMYEDACRIISAAGADGLWELLPDSSDADLLIALPRAVDLAMREHPELRQAMNDSFGTLGTLRVRQALAAADVTEIEAAAVQFFGTPAAALAHRALGDRHLAAGQFEAAIEQYRFARNGNDQDERGEVSARIRLAGAALGRNLGSPVAQPVEFGGNMLAADEFERLIAELADARRNPTNVAEAGDDRSESETQVLASSHAYEARVLHRFEGDMGQNAGGSGNPQIDWVARQLATVADAQRLYVSNRFQVAAYDVENGRQIWRTGSGGEQGEAHHWPLVPMRPNLMGDRLFVRRLTKQGPELACIATADGKLLWTNRPDQHVASDPLFVHGKLFALVAGPPQAGIVPVELVGFDAETGAVLTQSPVLRVRDLRNSGLPCQAAAFEGRIVCSVAGSLCCFDSRGRLHWLRRQKWIPPQTVFGPHDDHYQAPLIADGLVYVVQPGVFTVECLDLDNGRRVWRRTAPERRRLLGLAGKNADKLLIETTAGVEAVAPQTGEFVWKHDVEQPLDAYQIAADGGRLLLTQSATLQQNENCPALVFIDAETGRATEPRPVSSLKDKEPRFGTMLTVNKALWAFFGRGPKEPRRELVELKPSHED